MKQFAQRLVNPHDSLRLHLALLLKYLKRLREFQVGFRPCTAKGKQAPQVLVTNCFLELILDLKAERDAATCTGFGFPQ